MLLHVEVVKNQEKEEEREEEEEGEEEGWIRISN